MLDRFKRSIENRALWAGAILSIAALPLKAFGFSIGVILGTLISILNFRLLSKKVELVISGGQNPVAVFIGYIARYIIMAVVLWVCITKGIPYFLGAACGLFAVRIAMCIDSYIVKR